MALFNHTTPFSTKGLEKSCDFTGTICAQCEKEPCPLRSRATREWKRSWPSPVGVVAEEKYVPVLQFTNTAGTRPRNISPTELPVCALELAKVWNETPVSHWMWLSSLRRMFCTILLANANVRMVRKRFVGQIVGLLTTELPCAQPGDHPCRGFVDWDRWNCVLHSVSPDGISGNKTDAERLNFPKMNTCGHCVLCLNHTWSCNASQWCPFISLLLPNNCHLLPWWWLQAPWGNRTSFSAVLKHSLQKHCPLYWQKFPPLFWMQIEPKVTWKRRIRFSASAYEGNSSILRSQSILTWF